MHYDFDAVIDRRGTYSSKWESAALRRGAGRNGETIPMMVADMDFACAPALQAAMHRVADHGIYGYTSYAAEPRYLGSIADWYRRRHRTEIREEWVAYSDGSISAILSALHMFTNTGDGVIILRPVYGRFTGIIQDNLYRKVVSSHLLNDGGYYTVDWDDFERKCAVPTNRAFVLASPANPVGRVWSEGELRRLAEICRKHRVLFVSDEIHSDIVREGVVYRTILSATDDWSNVILVGGITKSFNVAGLRCANVVIPDDTLRGIFTKEFGRRMPSPFSIAAVIAAYDESEEWLGALNRYLDGNIDFALGFLRERLPQVQVWRPEGTYMLWLDFRAYGLSDAEIHRRIYVDANVLLQDGLIHDSDQGECFQRMCVALPRLVLEQALLRIAAVFA